MHRVHCFALASTTEISMCVNCDSKNRTIPGYPDTTARHRHNGKLPKVVIVACMRKLLTILNAMARDGAAWDPTKHAQVPQPA